MAMKRRFDSKHWLLATALSFLVLLSMSLYAWGSTSTSAIKTIANEGSVQETSEEATLLYSTNFDSLVAGQTYLTSSGSIPRLGGGNYFAIDGSNARVWCEDGESGVPLRRGVGTKCLGQQSTGRNEFNIYPQTIQSGIQKIYVTTWLYLEPSYELSGSKYWHEIANPTQNSVSQGVPKLKIQFQKASGLYRIVMNYQYQQDGRNQFVNLPGGIDNIPLADMPRGRWFQFRWFVDRVTGTIKSWIYDQGVTTMLCNSTGLDLGHSSSPNNWYTSVSKIYYGDEFYTTLYKIWIDEIRIYDDDPTTYTMSYFPANASLQAVQTESLTNDAILFQQQHREFSNYATLESLCTISYGILVSFSAIARIQRSLD